MVSEQAYYTAFYLNSKYTGVIFQTLTSDSSRRQLIFSQ